LPVDVHVRAVAVAAVDVPPRKGAGDQRWVWRAVVPVQTLCARREIGWSTPLTDGGRVGWPRSRGRCGGSRRWSRAGRRRRRCSPRLSRRSCSCLESVWRSWAAMSPTPRLRRSPARAGRAITFPLGVDGRLGGTISARSCSRPAVRPGPAAMQITLPARSVSTLARQAYARRSRHRSRSRVASGG
jgi:hypothetical protein